MTISRRAFLSLAALGCSPAVSAFGNAFAGASREGTLPNGLAYKVLQHPSARHTTVYMVYGSGCRHDPLGAEGTAHLVEHAMFRTTDASGVSADAQFKALGLEGTAFTTEDFTVYTSTVPLQHIPAVLAIEASRMRAMPMTAEALAVEKRVMLSEIATKDADFIANQRLTTAVMHGTGYANQLAGDPAQVEQISVSALQAFHADHYAPANAAIVLVGLAPAATMESWVAEAFGRIEKPFAAQSRHQNWHLPKDASVARLAPASAKTLALSWPGMRASETGLAGVWSKWSARALPPNITATNLCFEHTGRLVLSVDRNHQTVAVQALALRQSVARALRNAGSTMQQEGLRNAVELNLRLKRQAAVELAEQRLVEWIAQRSPVPARHASPFIELQHLLQQTPEVFTL
jgi:hypothetical protein